MQVLYRNQQRPIKRKIILELIWNSYKIQRQLNVIILEHLILDELTKHTPN